MPAYAEILRRIKEEEPPKPSTRLSVSRERLESIAAVRGIEPSRLTRAVRGDLDWIVMKAIEKSRTRRYDSAGGFARDIQRYLDGDAVEACPPSAVYRLRKFGRKYRGPVAVAAAFAGLVLVGSAISIALAVRATIAEANAKAEGVRNRSDLPSRRRRSSSSSRKTYSPRPDPRARRVAWASTSPIREAIEIAALKIPERSRISRPSRHSSGQRSVCLLSCKGNPDARSRSSSAARDFSRPSSDPTIPKRSTLAKPCRSLSRRRPHSAGHSFARGDSQGPRIAARPRPPRHADIPREPRPRL